uniref:CSON008746 protein n=1 Tax=Culicoides sonorensis TaxID=179676 RepID=A0A336LZ99_CULSO
MKYFFSLIILSYFQVKNVNGYSNVPKRFWDKTIYLKNSYSSEYLFAEKYIPETSGFLELGRTIYNRRRILTKKNKQRVPGAGEWILSTEDDGKTFTFQNKMYGEYLYSPTANLYSKPSTFKYNIETNNILSRGPYRRESDNKNRDRFVFTWYIQNKITTGFWDIIPIPDTGNEFWIRNAKYEEYLVIADDYNSEHRNVYTSFNGAESADKAESHWTFEFDDFITLHESSGKNSQFKSDVPEKFWNKTVVLSSVVNTKLLFAQNRLNETSGGQLIRKRVLAKKNFVPKACVWFLFTDDGGTSFLLQNKEYGEYLYSPNTEQYTKPTVISSTAKGRLITDSKGNNSNENWQERDRYVFTWYENKKAPQSYWNIIPIPDSQDEFWIRIVKNSYGHEYIYAQDYLPETSGLWELGPTQYHRRRVLTKIDKSIVPEAGEWFLSTDDNGRTFTFKNKKYGEYLYSPNTDQYTKPTVFSYNKDVGISLSKDGPSVGFSVGSSVSGNWQDKDRFVFTWHEQTKISQGYWYILPIPEKEDEFWIRNTAHNEYLYLADEFDSENRNIYTSLKGSAIAEYPESHWTIDQSNVPQNVWNQNVVIKNSYGLEYLYADDRIPETSGLWELGPTNYHRRRILTKTDKSIVPEAGEWFLSTDDNGRTFTLKNKKYNEYLYSPNTNQYTKPPLFGYNTEKSGRLSKGPCYKEKGPDDDWQFTDRYVFTWHEKEKVSTGYWYIIPIPGENENEFWIKNAAYDEYLYLADEFNAEHRNVYTALNRSDIADLLESHWKIELKPSKSNPSNVPKEFWNKTVTLMNVYRNEYLFAENVIPQTVKGFLWYTTYRHRRRILTKKNKQRISGADEWVLSTDDDGESFTFKNKQYDEYLYAANTETFTKPTFIAVHDITIKSAYGLEFLLAGDRLRETSGFLELGPAQLHRRQVFTKRNKESEPGRGEWILSTDNDGESFTFKNKEFGEYLYAANTEQYTKPTVISKSTDVGVSASKDGPSVSISQGTSQSTYWQDRDRYVFTWHEPVKDEDTYWYIEAVPERENEYLIQNANYLEYLYIADEHNSTYRNVYTSSKGSEITGKREAYWIIELVKSHSNVPKSLWGQTVTLKNLYLAEYLFAGEYLRETSGFWGLGPAQLHRRKITTKSDKNEVIGAAQWILSTDDDGFSFTLKNKRYGEYLYAANTDQYTKSNSASKSRENIESYPFRKGTTRSGDCQNRDRFVFTWHVQTKDDDTYWYIIPVKDQPNVFWITHTLYLEYLYVADRSEQNSFTTCRRTYLNNNQETLWKIELA